MRLLPLALLVGLAGCGGGVAPSAAERAFAGALRVARLDFAQGRFAEAADGFAAAELAAWRLDEPAAIATAGAERALSLLRADAPAAAAAESERLRRELERRGAPVPGLVPLVAAAAALALDDLEGADRALASALNDADPAVRARALFLVGRVALRRGDAATATAAAQALERVPGPGAAADRLELLGRLDLLAGRPAATLPRFAALIDARRAEAQPDAVGEALALAGDAAAAAGAPAEAADFYLRAARNALARGRPALAKERLARAAAVDDGSLPAELDALRTALPPD